MKNYIYKMCIEACLRCATISDHCASCCTQENSIKMMFRCIYINMQCSSICYTTARLMSLVSEKITEICNICADICEECGKECGKHDSKHCKECAAACTECAEMCRKMAVQYTFIKQHIM